MGRKSLDEFKEQIAQDIRFMQAEIDKSRKWISVEDMLPEANIHVLGIVENLHSKEISIIYCSKMQEWHYDYDNTGEDELSVTHWMPLPQPPSNPNQ